MSRRSFLPMLPAVLVLLSILTSCSQPVPEPVVSPLTREEISGERLWERISVDASFKSYSAWPGHDGARPGQSPHGSLHRIYINQTLLESLPQSDLMVPPGSIIVKENFNADEELQSITVMAKVDGFDPANNDWYWAAYSPAGELRVAGAVESCITCHAGIRRNDFIIIRPLDAPLP